MTFWDRLDAIRREWDVLDHPFYRRWSRGELAASELATYSGQYRHAVVALARASASAAPGSRHAAEEAAHIELWDRFVAAAGGDSEAEPSPETARCAATWASEERSPVAALAVLYAIESAQPAISAVKCRGLLEHYGFARGEATEYFDVHATLDEEHAAAHRAALEGAVGGADDDELLAAARDALAANWTLLDGVDRLGARA